MKNRKDQEQKMDILHYLKAQKRWSKKTFGPGDRTRGILDHIVKEFEEIMENPDDPMEWIDIAILALDGAWRTGTSPEKVSELLIEKQKINRKRKWPDWRTAEPGRAIEHDRSKD